MAACSPSSPSAAAGTAVSQDNTVAVRLSQESLFFPLPFSDVPIENVVQVRNLLPVDQAQPQLNTISFKALSAVRHRYSVHPPTGFIAPGRAVNITVLIDPRLILRSKLPEARVLPTEATRDAIYLDFAVVPSEAAEAALRHFDPQDKNANHSKRVQDDASTFWKTRGPAIAATSVAANLVVAPSTLRKKLDCVFTKKEDVPQTLVMHMTTAKPGTVSVLTPGSATTNATNTATTNTNVTPGFTNHTTNSHAAAPAPKMITNNGSMTSSSNGGNNNNNNKNATRKPLTVMVPQSLPTPSNNNNNTNANKPQTTVQLSQQQQQQQQQQSVRNANTNTVTTYTTTNTTKPATSPVASPGMVQTNVASPPLPQPTFSSMTSSPSGRISSLASQPSMKSPTSDLRPGSLDATPAVASPQSVVLSDPRRKAAAATVGQPLWQRVLQFRINYRLAAVFIVLSVLCGLFEKHTFFTWLLVRQ